MTPEERMKRNMEFIVEHQAQFVADIQRLQERDAAAEKRDAAAEKRMERGERRLDRLETILRGTLRAGQRARRAMREQDERIAALIDSQIKTEEITKQNSESISQLSEIVRQLATRQNGHGHE